MKIEKFFAEIRKINVQTITGVPDSTLQVFCDYLRNENVEFIDHIVAANEGAAVGIAIGEYLASGRPACVYLQNSGLGNVVNPVTSLANEEVYNIPILFIVGWRGEPGIKDEPQHKFMGKVTLPILDLLQIQWDVIDRATTELELNEIFERAKSRLDNNHSYAIVVKKSTFDLFDTCKYENTFSLVREDAISTIVEWMQKSDIVVSTTGKISRELYEQSDRIKGNHRQTFLTVGGMGHADMIAYQIARRKSDRCVICLDGDGALLMHMGSMAVIGQNPVKNFIHICINNEVHESVGGMPTGASGMRFSRVARTIGYKRVYEVYTKEELSNVLSKVREEKEMVFIEILVSVESRTDLGRPKETAEENKRQFMQYHGVEK